MHRDWVASKFDLATIPPLRTKRARVGMTAICCASAYSGPYLMTPNSV